MILRTTLTTSLLAALGASGFVQGDRGASEKRLTEIQHELMQA